MDSLSNNAERDNALCRDRSGKKAITDCVIGLDPGSPKWWAKVASAWIQDKGLKDKDFRVLCLLAAYVPEGSNRAHVGQRRLAVRLGKSQPYINARLKRLVLGGYIKQAAGRNGQRTDYVFDSEVFAPKNAPAECSALPPRDDKPKGICAHCARIRVLPVGRMCGRCIGAAKLAAKVADAKRIVGQDATAEEIAKHLKMGKLIDKIQKLMDREAA